MPQAILNYIALLGWTPKSNKEKFSLDELIEEFDVSGISHSHSIFDEQKMKWLNSEYLKEMSDDEFYILSKTYLDACDVPVYCDKKYLASLLKTRISILSEIPEKIEFLKEFRVSDACEYEHKKLKIDVEVVKLAMKCSLEILKKCTSMDELKIKEIFAEVAEKNNIKSGQIMFVMRLALTGCPVTPGGAVEMLKVLGLVESERRIKLAYEKINK